MSVNTVMKIRRSTKELSLLAALIGKSAETKNKYHGLLEAFGNVFKQLYAPSVNEDLLVGSAIQLLDKAQRLNDSAENLDIKQNSTQFATRIKGLTEGEVSSFVTDLKKADIEDFLDLLKQELQISFGTSDSVEDPKLKMNVVHSVKELASLTSIIGKTPESKKKYHGLLEIFGAVFKELYSPSVNINSLNSAAEQLLNKAYRLNDSGENLDIKRLASQFATRIRGLKTSGVRAYVTALKNANPKGFVDLLNQELGLSLGEDPGGSARRRNEDTEPSQPVESVLNILRVDFGESGNESDKFGLVIPTTVNYIYPRVRYSINPAPKTPIKVSYRLFSPKGEMEKNDKYQDGFLDTQELTSREGTIVFSGWGSTSGTAYYEGRWRFELYSDSKLINTTYFDIKSPFPKTPPSIDIQKVEFANTNYERDILNDFGTGLPQNTQYLTPRVSYTVRNKENREIELRYIIYGPDGVPKNNSSRNDRYTASTKINLAWNSPIQLVGFGNKEGTCYTPGVYKVEIYEGDYLLYTTNVTIGRPQAAPPKPTYTPPTPPPTPQPTKTDDSSSGGCFATLALTAVVIAVIFGLMKWCGRDDSDDKEVDGDRYVMATQVFLRSSPNSSGNSNIITKYPYGTKLSVIGESDGWLEVKEPESGRTGYVAKDYVIDTQDFNHLESIWGSRDIINDISLTRQRQALLDFYHQHEPEMGSSYFILQGPNENWMEKNIKDGYDNFPEFAFIVKDSETGRRQTVIYSFLSDEKPLLRHVEEAPDNGGIRNIGYKSKSGFNITYGPRKAQSKKSNKKTSSSQDTSQSSTVEEEVSRPDFGE